jgi:hypothetical protein
MLMTGIEIQRRRGAAELRRLAMSKVAWFVSMSLDGFTSSPDV